MKRHRSRIAWSLLTTLAAFFSGTVMQCYDPYGYYGGGVGWYGGSIDPDVFDYYNDQWDAYILE